MRLILERSPTAVDGVDALVGLLAHHGQGVHGPFTILPSVPHRRDHLSLRRSQGGGGSAVPHPECGHPAMLMVADWSWDV